MNCLLCGKPITEKASLHEKKHQWHQKCIQHFFGTRKMPFIEITEEKLEALANETVSKGLTVPGVQKKLSLHLSKEPDERLTIVDYTAGYILKPQTTEYEMLPEFEHMAMNMAAAAGIKTVENALISNNNSYSYITKRIDRTSDGDMLAMEDFCQLAERLTIDKYKGSYERCAGIISKYSSMPGLDLSELFIRVVFSFIIGNSDMHLKNFSMIETNPGSRKFVLSQAYDMLPVNIVLPDDSDSLALTLNGKRSNLKKHDFISFANRCGINETAASRIIEKLVRMESEFEQICDNSLLTAELKEQTKELIHMRVSALK